MHLYVAHETDVSVIAVFYEQILFILCGACAWLGSISGIAHGSCDGVERRGSVRKFWALPHNHSEFAFI